MEEALNRSPSDQTFRLAFRRIVEMLRQLKEAIVSLQSIWQQYQSNIEERSATQYSVAVEHPTKR